MPVAGWTLALVVVLSLAVAACGDRGTVPSPAAEPNQAHAASRPAPHSVHAKPLAAGLNAVGYDLFQAAAHASEGDVVLSPLSIGVAFGMADAGASGATATALEQLFDYPVDGEARWSAFNTLDQSVTDVGASIVRPANRMFPDQGFEAADGYEERLVRWFGAGVEPVALQNDPEQSRVRINEWVRVRTNKLIPELLPPGFIDATSAMILVNALYLKAKWELPFGKYQTERRPFRKLDGSSVDVPLMHELELSGPAVATDAYAATEIPYEEGQLSMLVIVPSKGRYSDVESRLDGKMVAEIDAASEKTSVELWLPRFDSKATLDLRSAIETDLNVKDVFGVPGWKGIAPGITLEDAVHAADISVDETGTVAAAATGLGFNESGPPEPEVTVRADRPFLYLIRHLPTGAVLFIGRVLDPST